MATGNTGVPPYLRAAQVLREQIANGTLRGRLPSETDLAAQTGVSKNTLRKALALLRDEGLIETFHGYGSHVLRPEDRR